MDESLWEKLAIYIPRPEVDEVKRIIGSNLIDETIELLQEASNIRSVISSVVATNDRRRSCKKLGDKKDVSCDFIASVKNYLTVDLIGLVVDDVRKFLNSEKLELNNEIKSLSVELDDQINAIMLTDGDGATTVSSNGSNVSKLTKSGTHAVYAPTFSDLCSLCGDPVSHLLKSVDSKIVVSTSSSSLLTISAATIGSNVMCKPCHAKSERREKKLADKLPKKHIVAATNATAIITATTDVDKSLDDKSNNRLRNKLQAAKDELHFLEDKR